MGWGFDGRHQALGFAVPARNLNQGTSGTGSTKAAVENEPRDDRRVPIGDRNARVQAARRQVDKLTIGREARLGNLKGKLAVGVPSCLGTELAVPTPFPGS